MLAWGVVGGLVAGWNLPNPFPKEGGPVWAHLFKGSYLAKIDEGGTVAASISWSCTERRD